MDAQKVFEKGFRKAVLTRITGRCWVAALGWAGEIQMRYIEKCRTRRMAMAYVNDWLIGD